jgi:hypothetical protein
MTESHYLNAKFSPVAVALLAGAGLGFFIGNYVGSQKGIAEGHTRGVQEGIMQERAAVAERQRELERKAAEAINPFEGSASNPFEKAAVNPYDEVKVNPFQ